MKGRHLIDLVLVQVTKLYSDVRAFLRYYFKLRFDVLRGRHQTSYPLGIWWRWRNWRHNQRLKPPQQQTQTIEVQDDPKATHLLKLKNHENQQQM